MTSWRDPKQWQETRSGVACRLCRSRPDSVAELEAAWVLAGPNDPVHGYACLVFSRHAVELHDLSASEGAAFMRDAQRLSRALASLLEPIKMNYEIHGNTVPHLHMHFFPRYVGDPFEGRPIDPRSVTASAYAPGEFATFRRSLAELLANPSAA